MTTIDDTVNALVRARTGHCTVPAVVPASADAAYAVQAAVARALGWFGTGVPRHWKSGGPSRDAVLTHAPLPPAGVWSSPAAAPTGPCIGAASRPKLRCASRRMSMPDARRSSTTTMPWR